MESIRNESAGSVVLDLVAAINEKRAYLSEIDGLIGDGDHGINMSKGFTRAGERLKGDPGSLTHALATLGEVLFEGIGGSMGPLYGSFFNGMAETLGQREVDAPAFGEMLAAAVAGLQEIGSAQVGDKTLIDALVPARDAFLARPGGGEALRRLPRRDGRGGGEGQGVHPRPGGEAGAGEPARRALARRARRGRHLLRPHPPDDGLVAEGQAGRLKRVSRSPGRGRRGRR